MDASASRQSRIRQLAGALQGMIERAWGPDSAGSDAALIRRFTPEQLSSYQASISRDAAESASLAAAGITTTNTNTRIAAQPATKGTTLATDLSTVANTYTQTVVLPTAATRSSAVSSSASSARTTIASSSSVVVLSSSSSSSTPVLTITSLPASSSTSLATSSTVQTVPSAVAANASSTESKSMSTGAIVGIVLGGLIGVVILGSTIGWLYRKFSNRGYGQSSSWRRMGGGGDDDDITPFNDQEKLGNGRYADDYYGGGDAAAPVIGSRRALALARSNFDQDSSSYRPQSEYYNNQAGVGTANRDFGAYPSIQPGGYAAAGGVDTQGRPYNPHGGRVPAGAYQDVNMDIVPVPLGRPAPPSSHADLMTHEDFADDPLSAGTTATYASHIAPVPYAVRQSPGSATNPPSYGGHTPPQSHAYSPPTASSGLPQINPVSPLGSAFTFNAAYGQPSSTHAQQKALYGQVARAAGVSEPITPLTPPGYGLSASTSSASPSSANALSNSTTSSFSAGPDTTTNNTTPPPPHSRLPAPPMLTLSAPQPYQHGQPLSPLLEVSTPGSFQSGSAPAPSYERLPVPAPASIPGSNQRVLVAPHSAASSTGATHFPSPAYPPPSPGGMSVPGSVTDSPRRWSGHGAHASGGQVGRGVSIYSGEDAYGGI